MVCSDGDTEQSLLRPPERAEDPGVEAASPQSTLTRLADSDAASEAGPATPKGLPGRLRHLGLMAILWLMVVGAAADLLHTLARGMDTRFVHDVGFWLFAALLVGSECRPLRVPWVDGPEQITPSAGFAFAILLFSGAQAAMVSVAVACAVAAAVDRRGPVRGTLAGARYVLTLSGAATLLTIGIRSSVTTGAVSINVGTELPVAASAGAFFVVWAGLSALSQAILEGLPPLAYLSRDFGYQATTAGIVMAVAPLAAVAAERTVAVIPLLLVPLASVYRSASIAAAREHDALHDHLTGLPNRSHFAASLERATDRARKQGGALAVMMIDLDGFKEVNDTLGHETGDQLLRHVAARLAHHLRAGDLIARLGGDEFAVCLPSITGMDDAAQTARRLLQALQDPVHLDAISLTVHASVGIAGYPDHGLDTATLLQRADVAMYQAKSVHSGVELYAQGRDTSSRRRLVLTGEIRQAIENDELVLWFQPQARLSDGRITGAEALVRWEHPFFGRVGPDEFIPLAENSGVMRRLTMHVVDHALRQWKQWNASGLEMAVAVNISTQNFHDEMLPDQIARLLSVNNVPARYLEIEITESTLIADTQRATRILTKLAEMGVRIMIDDFGTGYSSLSYLHGLPVTGMKIDQSFVRGLGLDGQSDVIVRSTLDLGRNLGLEVVAEGVETMEAYEVLAGLGCDYIQGYLVSRPMNGTDLAAWLEARRPRPPALAPSKG